MDLSTPPVVPTVPPMLTLADLSQSEKDKVQRIVAKVVSLGQENDELLCKYRQESNQHDALVLELRAKLQKTTGLLYLYQSTLESRAATDVNAEYEVLLVKQQSVINDLRQKQAELGSELEIVKKTVSFRDHQVDDLVVQLRCERSKVDETKERCNRLEAACLGLTKQLAAMGLRMRTTIQDQHRRSAEEKPNNSCCHASTQCDVRMLGEQTPFLQPVMATAAMSTDESTAVPDKNTAAKRCSKSERILTMTGYVPVPVPFPTMKGGDEQHLRRSTASIHKTTTPQLHDNDANSDDDGHYSPVDDNDGNENRRWGRNNTTTPTSPNEVGRRRNANRDGINAQKSTTCTATTVPVCHQMIQSASAASEKMDDVSAPRLTTIRPVRRPLVDIDTAVKRSETGSKQQMVANRKTAVAATRPHHKQRQPNCGKSSSRTLFDGDYDAELFLLLDDIEKL